MGDRVGDGQAYELPVHAVQVRPFALGRYEVTWNEWKACQAAGACTESSVPADSQNGSNPVAGISWSQATAYAEWLTRLTRQHYRLPSEAEWEYAARSGAAGSFPWPPQDDVCKHVNLLDVSGHDAHEEWYWFVRCSDGYSGAAPVGSYPANVWGFHEMLGNVWEWVADCWHSDYTGAPVDSTAWIEPSCRKHVNRGGGWGNNLRALRLSNRDADPTSARSEALGFRIARDLSPEEVARLTPARKSIPVPSAQAQSTLPSPGVTAAAAPPSARHASVIAAAHERDLEAHLTVRGQQTWSKPPQHSTATTDQDVVLGLRLRSDGTRYADNLLDPNPEKRFAIKQRHYSRLGLIEIKASNGGKLPTGTDDLRRLAAQVQAGMTDCATDPHCADDVVYRAAALDVLTRGSSHDVDALLAPATDSAARWLYYFGFAGCPSHLHVTYRMHLSGERSILVGGSRMQTWEVDRFADSRGTADDLQQLCRNSVATIDTWTGDVYLENFNIPAVTGTAVRAFSGDKRSAQEPISVPTAVIPWINEKLRRTRETATYSDNLSATAPFDEDYTIQGTFEGHITVKLDWSFKASK